MNNMENTITSTRNEMMKKMKCENINDYLEKVEDIAWWYIYAITNGFNISATREKGPLMKEELDLPIEIKTGENNE